MKAKRSITLFLFLNFIFCALVNVFAQHPRSAVPDSLNGWYVPFDSATYQVRKHQPSCMHFMNDGKYEVFGVAAKGKQWMYKGNWRESNDTVYFYYDWSFDETIHAKYLSTLTESVPFRDTLVFSNGKYHYADPGAGIPPFVLVKADFSRKLFFPVNEAVHNLLKVYSKEIYHAVAMNKKNIAGIYSWQGDAGQTTLKLKRNGKYRLYHGDMRMKFKEKGKWEEISDTLVLKVKFSRMYYVIDEFPVRRRKFIVDENGITELKNKDVTSERHLYIMHRKYFHLFRHRFHRSLHG